MKTTRKILAAFLTLAACIGLMTSCSVLPTEEDVMPPPISKPEEAVYKTKTVEAGDIQNVKYCVGNFTSTSTETMSFQLDQGTFFRYLVEKGDIVKKGQVLAEAENTTIAERISELEDSMYRSDLQNSYNMNRLKQSLDNSKANLSAAKTSLSDLKNLSSSLKSDITKAEKELSDAKAALKKAEDALAAAKKKAEEEAKKAEEEAKKKAEEEEAARKKAEEEAKKAEEEAKKKAAEEAKKAEEEAKKKAEEEAKKAEEEAKKAEEEAKKAEEEAKTSEKETESESKPAAAQATDLAALEAAVTNARSAVTAAESKVAAAKNSYNSNLTGISDLEKQIKTMTENIKLDQQNYDMQETFNKMDRAKSEKALAEYKAQLAETQLIAPFDGKITYLASLLVGDMISKDVEVLTIADPDSLVFIYNVKDDTIYDQFYSGREVEIYVNSIVVKGEIVQGTADIDPEILKEKEDARIVYIKCPDLPDTVKMGNNGGMNIILEEKHDVILVDSANVFSTGYGDNVSYFCYVLEDGLPVIRNVEVGIQTTSQYEIVSGLQVGDELVINY